MHKRGISKRLNLCKSRHMNTSALHWQASSKKRKASRKIGPSLQTLSTKHWFVALILCMHLLLAVVYSLIIPIGEGYDEWGHFAYVRYLVRERDLPASGQRLVPECEFDMTHHPPLYYLICAGACSWVDMSDNLRPEPNPHFDMPNGGLNAFIHSSEEKWPYQGSVLGFHVARIVSALMGTATCLVTYMMSRELFPQRGLVQVLSLAIVSFMPQLIFMSSIVNNDIAITLFLSLFMFTILRMVTRGPSLSRWGWLIMVSVAAILTKANAVVLLPTALIVLPSSLLLSPREVQSKHWLGLIAFSVITTAVLLLWESWNTEMEGHWASTGGAIRNVLLPALLRGPRYWIAGPDWASLWESITYAHITYWGSFGWGNMPLATWIYWILAVFVGLAGVGVGKALATTGKPEERMGITALLIFCVLSVLLPAYLVLLTGHISMFPGRYVLPISGPLAILLVWGLLQFPASHHVPMLPLLFSSGLLALSIYVPISRLAPAYKRPDYLIEPFQIEEPVSFTFGDGITFLGFEGPSDGIQPDRTEEFVLYWQANRKIENDYSVDIQVIDAKGHLRGATRTYPGHGTFPTSLWEPGRPFRDLYYIDIGPDIPTPGLARIKLHMYDHHTGKRLQVTGSDGEAVGEAAIFGRLRAYAEKPSQGEATSPLVSYGESIDLLACQGPSCLTPGETASFVLQWVCRHPPKDNYMVFLHLVNAEGETIAQMDGAPINGRYPTDLWVAGDTINDQRMIVLPENMHGPYYLQVGFYSLSTMERLPAYSPNGSRLLHDQYVSDSIYPCSK